jgi:hypothetical protein
MRYQILQFYVEELFFFSIIFTRSYYKYGSESLMIIAAGLQLSDFEVIARLECAKSVNNIRCICEGFIASIYFHEHKLWKGDFITWGVPLFFYLIQNGANFAQHLLWVPRIPHKKIYF